MPRAFENKIRIITSSGEERARVNLTVNVDLLKKARERGINLTLLLDGAIRQRLVKAEQWETFSSWIALRGFTNDEG